MSQAIYPEVSTPLRWVSWKAWWANSQSSRHNSTQCATKTKIACLTRSRSSIHTPKFAMYLGIWTHGKAHFMGVNTMFIPQGIVTHGQIVLEWLKTSQAQRKSHVEVLLESLEHRDTEIRFTNARKLLYLLQGSTITPRISLFLKSAPSRDLCRDYLSRASSSHDYWELQARSRSQWCTWHRGGPQDRKR